MKTAEEMTLGEFMKLVKAWDNNNGSWSVELILKDETKSILTIENCTSEYDAKERAFLYLIDRINESRN